MSENSFICIKINNWFSTIEFRQHFFLSIDFFFIIIILTADLSLIWSDQTRFCQHSFLSSISYRSTFQQLIFSDQTEISSALFFIIDSYRSIFSTAGFFWSNKGPASTSFYHRFIQINFFNSWSLSDQMRVPLAFLSIIDPYRSNFDFFQLK